MIKIMNATVENVTVFKFVRIVLIQQRRKHSLKSNFML
jgi:hypothetical protein